MKLKTIKGQWILEDNGRKIDFKSCGLAAWDYVLTMKGIRTKQTEKTNRELYPVKSLSPHPKKRRISVKYKRIIKQIKSDYQNGIHSE